jgi:hypothetical protein
MNNKTTPETDNFDRNWDSYSEPWKAIEFARRLERERDEVTKDLEFRRDLFKAQEDQLNYIRKQLSELRESSKLLVKQLALQIEYPAYTVDEVVEKMFLMDKAKRFIK